MTTAYKGFTPGDGALICRDKTYREGETYTEDEAVLCRSGMHACLAPIDVLAYYPPATSVYHVVEVGDDAEPDPHGDSKVATRRLTVGASIGIPGIVKAQIEYVRERATVGEGGHATGYLGAASATGDRGAASATGDRGAASATGYQGAASATGDQGAASATGDRGAASATGDRGAASATGDRGAASATGDQGAASATGYRGAASATGYLGAASATGYQGAASATGYQGAASATGDQGAASATGYYSIAHADGLETKARGAEGCGLTLAERDDNGALIGLVAVIVGREHEGQVIEPMVWYALRDGQVVQS